jgi:predicted unusual protein kinase regulating ubiquinone biosynthesis (AarF/ABC1/UbiB family)
VKKDWEKLAGEEGEKVSSSKLKRAFRLGSVGAGVAASSLAGKLKSFVRGGSDDEEEQLRELYRKNADKMADVLGQLKGASMKVGQMLSADPEMIPPEFADGLARLQRDAPPMTWTTVKDQLETSLGRPIESVFSRFDPEPVGAASIGQVHRARLETGEDVAVKLQYPGVSDALDSDLDTLKSMLVWGRPFVAREKLDRYFEEIRDVLQMEADYLHEAEQLSRFQEHLCEREDVIVPRPYPEWSSKNVLVMEFIEGVKLDDALEAMGEHERSEMLYQWLSLFVWMFHELHELHADPHPGNFLLTDDGKLAVLDFGCVREFEPRFADGMLEIVTTVWEDDPERALEIYDELGFGTEDFDPRTIGPDLVREYHEIVLAPFLDDKPYRFGGWQPALEGKKFMMRHPSFLQLTPPSDALLYFRLLSGIKGLLGKFDVELSIRPLAEETAIRRGLW